MKFRKNREPFRNFFDCFFWLFLWLFLGFFFFKETPVFCYIYPAFPLLVMVSFFFLNLFSPNRINFFLSLILIISHHHLPPLCCSDSNTLSFPFSPPFPLSSGPFSGFQTVLSVPPLTAEVEEKRSQRHKHSKCSKVSLLWITDPFILVHICLQKLLWNKSTCSSVLIFARHTLFSIFISIYF